MDVTIAVIDDQALALGKRILAESKRNTVSSNNKKFVFFWQAYQENGHFSQWYPAPFRVEGIHYFHTEQYMMAKKALLFGDTRTYNKIMKESDPAACKALGKSAANFNQQLWDACKEEIIYNANYAKFSQNPGLKAALLATGDAIIAEASPYDRIWGIGLKASDPDSQNPKKWKGQNLLGKALMRVREAMLEENL
ncbi:MAG: NADAR family protein [Oscillospiraceae bacterium]|nr:NADAR family protein [Oscillospiraceae bacterium]MBQ7130000.1 NADAR family protein [Oscillospiraceae bacterium]